MTVDDLRRFAEQVRENFLGDDPTYYDTEFIAWRDQDDGRFYVCYHERLYRHDHLFEAVRLVLRILRGR